MKTLIIILVILAVLVVAALALFAFGLFHWGRRQYQRYSGLGHQRDSAKQSRMAGYDRLKRAERDLVEAERTLAACGSYTEAQAIEQQRTRLSTIADRLRYATYGYSPVGSRNPIREGELAALQQRDADAMTDAQAIADEASAICHTTRSGQMHELATIASLLDLFQDGIDRPRRGELMPIEQLSCTACGSTDVKEVKPDTYFCNHCEGVFKHIDSSRVLTVPTFCQCGEPIAVSCGVCGRSICGNCDAAPLFDRYEGRPFMHVVAIPMENFGYLFMDKSPSPLALVNERLVDEHSPGQSIFKGSIIDGPVLFTPEILTEFAVQHPNIRHHCWQCTLSVLPDVVSSIADGNMCIEPLCTRESVAACRCCHALFCALHLSSESLIAAGQAYGLADGTHVGITASAPRMYVDAGLAGMSAVPLITSYAIPFPGGLCRPCFREQENALVARAQEQFGDALTPDFLFGDAHAPEFRIAVPIVFRGNEGFFRRSQQIAQQYEANDTAVKLAKQCAKELSAYLEQRLLEDLPCDFESRDWTFVDYRSGSRATVAAGVLVATP